MFKRILVIYLASLCSIATAEDWREVAKSTTGVQLMADIDTITALVSPSSQDVTIEGTMTYTGKESVPPFKARIDARQCFEHQKGDLINIFVDGKELKNKWSVDGRKMTDAQGQFLCAFTIEVLRTYERNNNPSVKRIKA